MILEPQYIIDAIRKRGMELVAAGDMVRFRPQSAMTPELLQLLKLNKAGVLEVLSDQNPEPHHPLADFDSSIFGDPPRYVQHKASDCQSTDFWQHRFGGFYCSTCWPCTDAVMRIKTDDRPEPRPELGGRPKPKTEWTSEEELLIGWFEQNFSSLSAENFQHEINLAGLQQQLHYGPAYRDARKVIADLRLLKTDPERFHDLLEQRHERELNQWKPRHRREK